MSGTNFARSSLSTLAEIEDAIRAYESPGQPALAIAKDAIKQFSGAMHDTSRLQAIATWARNAKDPYLSFHSANKMVSVLDDLCSVAAGLVAMRLSQGVRVGGDTVLRRDALDGATQLLSLLDRGDFTRGGILGRTLSLPCISGTPYEFLGPLFEFKSPRGVKRDVDLARLMQKLFKDVATSDSLRIPSSFATSCGVFASELFTNTQEHAIRDHLGHAYDAHVEGIILSWAQMFDRVYAHDFGGHQRLRDFWQRESVDLQAKTERGLRCFQLSFFDTGPGFASRATGMETTALGLQEERDALIRCLQKSVTTKSGSGVGHGLPGVLEELRKVGGLMRIRSGRHCIFNCFEPNDGADLFDFHDWTAEPLGAAVGAVISILVPIRRS